jgi:diacylglycerol kinase family enzyme
VQRHATLRPTAGERAAALLSLLALAAAVVLLLAGVTLHLAGALLTLAGVFVCVVGGWYAVSRRGVFRAAGLVAMVAGVAVLGAGLLAGDFSFPRVILLVAAAALSVVSARYALRPDERRWRALQEQTGRASRARHPVLIMNLKSGGGKAERFQLAEECERRGIEPIVLKPGDDLLQLADDAVGRGADVIGMAGGDGSQALVATVASRRDVPHVVVPAGTRNHFALDLGLDRDDVVGALEAFSDGVERTIDLAAVNGRVFVNNASLGLYAKVVQSPEYRDAKLATAASMLPDLLGPDAAPLGLRFTGPDGADVPGAQLILVSNDPYQLDHIGGRGTRMRLDGGVLGIVAATIANAADAAQFVALEAAGQVRRFRGWREWNTPRFEVSSDAPIEIGVDGEALLMNPPLHFESRPGALRVRLPRHAIRPSPAARAGRVISGSTVAELAGLAAGR